jgi:hypothetical protein
MGASARPALSPRYSTRNPSRVAVAGKSAKEAALVVSAGRFMDDEVW